MTDVVGRSVVDIFPLAQAETVLTELRRVVVDGASLHQQLVLNSGSGSRWFEMSLTLISSVTDAVMDEAKAWQARPLEALYPIVYLDCIHVKTRDAGAVRAKAVYLALGVLLLRRLASEGQKLDPWQRRALIHSCRQAKEQLLGAEARGGARGRADVDDGGAERAGRGARGPGGAPGGARGRRR